MVVPAVAVRLIVRVLIALLVWRFSLVLRPIRLEPDLQMGRLDHASGKRECCEDGNEKTHQVSFYAPGGCGSGGCGTAETGWVKTGGTRTGDGGGAGAGGNSGAAG